MVAVGDVIDGFVVDIVVGVDVNAVDDVIA